MMTEKPKRIIVCCDGTGSSIFDQSQNGHSGVSRIKRCIATATTDGTQQISFYVPGIGTHEEDILKRYSQGVGKGVHQKIRTGYTHICDNYATDRDQIILIGFSRGAFIARCIADIVCRIGLLTKRGFPYLNLVYRKWRKCEGATYPLNYPRSDEDNEITLSGSKANALTLREENGSRDPDLSDPNAFDSLLKNKILLRRQIRIKVCALWDTVAAIGPKLTFVDSDLLDGIDNAFHALALHERRRDFFPIIWRKTEDTIRQEDSRLQQCWFVGYHSNLGGSKDSDSLAHISLAWIMGKLQDFVEFDTNNFCQPPPEGSSWVLKPVNNEPKIKLKIQDSMHGLWKVRGSLNRKPCRQFRLNTRFQDNMQPGAYSSNELIHWTVRVIESLGAFHRCKSMRFATLRDLRTSDAENNTYDWAWDIPNKFGPDYTVYEEKISISQSHLADSETKPDLEITLLGVWLDSELEYLQRNSNVSNADPQTFIAKLKSEIWEKC